MNLFQDLISKPKNAMDFAIAPVRVSNDKKGFTLAEVLITLAVIGIVAAMAIPSLMNSYEELAYRSHLEKAYASLSQAVVQINFNGTKYWPVEDTGIDHRYIRREFDQYMESVSSGGLGALLSADYLTAIDMSNYYSMYKLNDGSFFIFKRLTHYGHTDADGRNYYASVRVDLNGEKGPNRDGKDFHFFYVVGFNSNQLEIRPGGYPGSDGRYGGDGCDIDNALRSHRIACTYEMLFK